MADHDRDTLDFPLPGRISKMEAAEIIKHFEWLDFRDDHDHKLTMCDDFLELVDLATDGNRREVE